MNSPSAAITSTAAATLSRTPTDEIIFELLPLIRVYKSGAVERLCGTTTIPPSSTTKLHSKDVIINAETNITARLYLPTTPSPPAKLPILLYFHGGAFLIESAFSPTYDPHLKNLSLHAPLLAVSVNYRLAPENPLPNAYQDAWAALQWVCSQADPWIKDRGDLDRVYIAGDSAGANIVQQMAVRAGAEGVKIIKGMALVDPYFWGEEPVGRERRDVGFREDMERLWRFVCPGTSGVDDPRINPVAGEGAASLKELGCERVVVVVAGQDVLWSRGMLYYEELKTSGWRGEVQLVDTPDAVHDFHIFYPETEAAMAVTKKLAAFFV
ncbi:probable carboxylesterase 2 [Phalaenopsis equestris]|uniref:probable carboxylesterase 2 n=1 Tax=Phalaenopsis equestris TaxID=78828 RepID=UPI0009E5EFFE|nr:probable carboxylesterase 2 [Phalaenopsis equestris]